MRIDEDWRLAKRDARLAGLLYLIVVATGFFSLLYVPSQFVVEGDATATVGKIAASMFLLKLGVVAGVICYTAFIVLPLVLYRLLGRVSKSSSVVMVSFALVSVPISLISQHHRLNVVSLLSDSNYSQAFSTAQFNAQVMLSLESYSNCILISTVFWGLWLFPLGYLVFKSDFLPGFLGILLMVGCFGYLMHFIGELFIVGFAQSVAAGLISLPSAFGEIGICLYLLIIGVRRPKSMGISESDEPI